MMIRRVLSSMATFAVGVAGGYLASKVWVETS
jgi:hypothetical protein